MSLAQLSIRTALSARAALPAAVVPGARLASSLAKGPAMDWTKQSWATLSHIPERVQIEGSDPNARVNADHSNVRLRSPVDLPRCSAGAEASTGPPLRRPADRVRVSAHVAEGQGRLLQADGRDCAEGLDHALDQRAQSLCVTSHARPSPTRAVYYVAFGPYGPRRPILPPGSNMRLTVYAVGILAASVGSFAYIQSRRASCSTVARAHARRHHASNDDERVARGREREGSHCAHGSVVAPADPR